MAYAETVGKVEFGQGMSPVHTAAKSRLRSSSLVSSSLTSLAITSNSSRELIPVGVMYCICW